MVPTRILRQQIRVDVDSVLRNGVEIQVVVPIIDAGEHIDKVVVGGQRIGRDVVALVLGNLT